MPNNQGFLTGTGGAASAYTVGASDVGAGVLAQQMHPMYFDSATNTWKTVNTNDRLPVAIAGSVTIGSATPTTGNLLVGRDADGLARAINVDATGKIVISNPSSGGSSGGLTDIELRATPVPVSVSGVATAANQATGNTTLTAIDTKLGGTLAVSLPTTATNAATAPNTGGLIMGKDSGGLAKAIAVDSSGQIIISNPSSGGSTGGLTDTQLRATPVPVSLAGSATSALQTTGNTTLAAIDTKLGGTLTVSTGGLTDTQLRASAISTTVSNFPATQAVSATALPLPTGAATSALQTTANTSLASVDGKLTTTTVNSVVRLNTTLASSGTTGTAAPTVANLYAGTDGTNLRAISTDSSGRQRVVLDSQVLPASGGNLAIGVTPTATQVTGTGTATQFITLQNSYASASYIYYGFSSGTATPTTGLELKVGDIVNLPLSAATSLWLSANTGSSAIAKIGWM